MNGNRDSAPLRLFPVTVKLFKPSGKWYATELRMMAAKDCGSSDLTHMGKPGVVGPPTAYTGDLIATVRRWFAAREPIADGSKGATGWFVTLDGEDVVPHHIVLEG